LAGSLRNAGGTNSAKFIHFVDYIWEKYIDWFEI
jgi:hypothetical protein